MRWRIEEIKTTRDSTDPNRGDASTHARRGETVPMLSQERKQDLTGAGMITDDASLRDSRQPSAPVDQDCAAGFRG